MIKAVAYYRTSSATNVGEDKDSHKRQEDACKGYAAKHGMEVCNGFYDAAVRGSESVVNRAGFSEMIEYMNNMGISVILVETVNRFSRDLIVQLTGYEFLRKGGISLIPVDCPTHFQEDTPTAKMVRQILGAVSEFEKSSLVEKLRKARDRKRATMGRCEGRKPVPSAVTGLAVSLRASGASYRAIGAKLLEMGHGVIERGDDGKYYNTGKAYKAGSVKLMVGRDKVDIGMGSMGRLDGISAISGTQAG